jgi:hypothetical protein
MNYGTDPAELYRQPPRRRLLQLALYAIHLGTCSTLLCRTIKSNTIKKYVNTAASFHALFGQNPRDFRNDNVTDTKVSPELSKSTPNKNDGKMFPTAASLTLWKCSML